MYVCMYVCVCVCVCVYTYIANPLISIANLLLMKLYEVLSPRTVCSIIVCKKKMKMCVRVCLCACE